MQTISLVGTWAHDLARAWIIIEMLGKASALGSLLLASAIPGLLLTLQGGVLADRKDVKTIMIVTKSILAIAALVLACVVEFANIKMWHLLVFGLIEGCVVAFDAPTFQALTVRLVPREDFQQAIALNSTNFHAARMLGPVVAGGLMYWHGPSLVFLFDAVSYLGLILILARMPGLPRPALSRATATNGHLLREGLRYVVADPRLRYLLLQLFFTISLALPVLMVILRTFMAARFQLNEESFGLMFMFPAMGSMGGALSFAAFHPRDPLKALQGGVPLAVIALIGVPFAPTAAIAAALMFVTGFATYLSLASLTVSLHLAVREEFRGRLSSLITLGFNSFGPLMSFPLGLYSDIIGPKWAIVSLAAVFALGSATLAFLNRSAGPALFQDF